MKIYIGIIPLVIACISVISVHAIEAKNMMTIWYLPTTTSPVASTNPSYVQVDMTATPLELNKNSAPPLCIGEDFYCAKGFTNAQVDNIHHRPSVGANAESSFLVYHN